MAIAQPMTPVPTQPTRVLAAWAASKDGEKAAARAAGAAALIARAGAPPTLTPRLASDEVSAQAGVAVEVRRAAVACTAARASMTRSGLPAFWQR